jgi:hypothetical protein
MGLANPPQTPAHRPMHAGRAQHATRRGLDAGRDCGERAGAHAALVEGHRPARQRLLVAGLPLAEIDLRDPKRRRGPASSSISSRPGE